MPIIEVNALNKIYRDGDVETKVLHNVSFSVERGEFVAIMGPSGSGKSTLLHILGFLDRHTSGKYCFEGKIMDDYSEEELARVRNEKMGFVFQAFNLMPRTTVFDNVRIPLLYSRIPRDKHEDIVHAAIESVALSHRIHHEPSQLSGGEKQRVAIARALVNKPSVIFADEPTGNLDSHSGKMVMEIIQKLNEEDGHTIFLITHETYTAEHAKRIIKLVDGSIESDAEVNHRHNASAQFIK